MATYETSMFEDTMFEHVEDTEMAVDVGKYVQHDGDVDIDLDFVDHPQQDEMMMEDHAEPVYDLELDDAVLEQDAEMTDESAEDDVRDEEIADAPAEQIHEESIISDNQSSLLPEAQHIDATIAAAEGAVSVQRSLADVTTVVSETQNAAEEPEPAAITTSEQANRPSDSDVVGEPVVQHEEEELITWESDDEQDTHVTGNVGNVTSLDATDLSKSVESKDENANGSADISTKEQADLDGVLDSLDKSSKDSELPNDVNEQGEVQETITYEDEEDEEDDESQQNHENDGEDFDTAEKVSLSENQDQTNRDQADLYSGQHKAISVTEAEAGKAAAVVKAESTAQNGQTQEHIEESALGQLHPIVLRYMGQEMSLFPPTIEEEHTVFFLSEKKLAFDTCENLFKAFRQVLGDNVTNHETLILSCPDLDLEINEGIPETSTLSVAQLLHLHLGLLQNDGHEDSMPLLIELKHYQDVSTRLNELYALMGEGKGYSSLNSHELSAGINRPDGVVDPEHVERVDNEGAVLRDGYNTPRQEDEINVRDDEPDFSSPATMRTDLQPAIADAEADTAEISANSGKEDAVGASSIQNEYDINYEGDEDEEGTLIPSATRSMENVSTTPNTNLPVGKHFFQSQSDLADVYEGKEISRDKDTNNRDKTGSLDNNIHTSISGEHHNTEENKLNDVSVAQDSLGRSGPLTTQKTESKAISTNQVPENLDDGYEEIDYSDHEGPDEDIASTVNTSNVGADANVKPASPKRTLDEAEDPSRDAKRLRSS